MTGGGFHATRWTLVLQARGEGEPARAALSDLCAAYYEPVVAFLRREGRSGDAARETAHEFFGQLLASGLGSPDPERGRFRSYLLGALRHFLGKRRARELAAKRGGGAEHVSLTAAGLPGVVDETLAFDRDWALALIGRALERLGDEHAENRERFEALKPWLNGAAGGSQVDLARRLGLGPTAVKVAVHRMRVRFRELIRAEVAATVADPEEVAEELRHLVEVASRG